MEYNDFLQCVQERTREAAGEGGSVTINHIIKNNGCELDGLVIMEEGSNISPTIYLNNFFEQYQDGRVLEEIVGEIKQIYHENKERISVNPAYFKDFKQVKNQIVYKIINYEKNKKLLERVPYKKILDLAVVFYCLIDQQSDGNATALIYNSHVEAWKVTEDDVYQAAVENTPKLLESTIRPMSAIIKEMMSKEAVEDCSDYAANEMFVLTNRAKINGASCILYENVLKNFAAKMDCDLYILPSSIHEVILLPKLPTFDKDELAGMVREVNSEGVSKEEILSDHVYVYNREDGLISL